MGDGKWKWGVAWWDGRPLQGEVETDREAVLRKEWIEELQDLFPEKTHCQG